MYTPPVCFVRLERHPIPCQRFPYPTKHTINVSVNRSRHNLSMRNEYLSNELSDRCHWFSHASQNLVNTESSQCFRSTPHLHRSSTQHPPDGVTTRLVGKETAEQALMPLAAMPSRAGPALSKGRETAWRGLLPLWQARDGR